jgi:hypothetical protein
VYQIPSGIEPRFGIAAERLPAGLRLTDNQEVVGLCGLALICAERTHQTRRFQSSSAPRVLRPHRTRATRTCAAAHDYAELRRKTKGRFGPALVF